ncbi:efflux transporter outer membrane subunit [Hephaestia sp. GCM10023244]|uniref:efflux transporter outer membrane subunit n=1 Tax=unclassified Hephaestia TaxID=2631281 RepID=UPI002076DC25|nr:efflux transporter outer membrane subunit [Hephaestia sp. MAHUQ-44]MCM8731910.1 efflux transporter outer membrane subunit [Hephaestia sp. MAHUQ-44]
MARLRSLLLMVPAASLAACAVGPNYRPASPGALGVPDRFSVAADARAQEDLSAWWTRFDDPLLTRLVEQARAGNLSVAQAVSRLRQAHEGLIQSRAQWLPQVSGSGGYSRSFDIAGASTVTLPDGTVTTISRTAGDSFSVGGNVSYQLGLFGEVGRGVAASRAQYEGAGYDYATVLISTEAEIARNYVLARGYQAQLANARQSLAIQDDNLEITGFRVQAGLVSSLDQEQARAARAQTAASVPSIEQSYSQAVARLGVLTGQAPGALRGEMEAVKPIPVADAAVAIGIPADTLRQRPDVRAAERALAASVEQIGIAEAQLYPGLSIGGSVSTNATAIGNLFDIISGQMFANLAQTIFDGGRRRSQVRANEAAAEAAFAAYKGTVLTSLEDIENAVVAMNTARERAAQYGIALDAANNSAILARVQYRAGLTDFTTLNTAEGQLLSARNGLTQAKADQATALVQLYLALGGGWDSQQVPVAPDTPATFQPAEEP